MRKYITKASERIGVESTSRDGKRAQVVSYSTCENFIIRFCDGKEMKLKNWRYFIEGNFNYEKHFKAPRNREERIGEKKVMNNGLTAEVIEYRGSHDMDILFEDGGKRTGVSWRDFCIGSIAHPTISGGNVSQNELVLRFYLESLGFVRIPQRSKRSDRVGLEGKAYMCKQRGMHLGSKISREEITKKVNQSKYEKYCYITNRLRREQFPLDLF